MDNIPNRTAIKINSTNSTEMKNFINTLSIRLHTLCKLISFTTGQIS